MRRITKVMDRDGLEGVVLGLAGQVDFSGDLVPTSQAVSKPSDFVTTEARTLKRGEGFDSFVRSADDAVRHLGESGPELPSQMWAP